MMFLAAHAPDGLLAPGGFLGTSHRFLFKIGRQNTTSRKVSKLVSYKVGCRVALGVSEVLVG